MKRQSREACIIFSIPYEVSMVLWRGPWAGQGVGLVMQASHLLQRFPPRPPGEFLDSRIPNRYQGGVNTRKKTFWGGGK